MLPAQTLWGGLTPLPVYVIENALFHLSNKDNIEAIGK